MATALPDGITMRITRRDPNRTGVLVVLVKNTVVWKGPMRREIKFKG